MRTPHPSGHRNGFWGGPLTNAGSKRDNPEPLAQIVGREIISFCWLAALAECVPGTAGALSATTQGEPAREGSQHKEKQSQGWIIPDDTTWVSGSSCTGNENYSDICYVDK